MAEKMPIENYGKHINFVFGDLRDTLLQEFTWNTAYLKSIGLTKFNLFSADFGFARFLQDGVMAATLCGSPMYMVSFVSLVFFFPK